MNPETFHDIRLDEISLSSLMLNITDTTPYSFRNHPYVHFVLRSAEPSIQIDTSLVANQYSTITTSK
jgi:hypothetical protein